MYTSIPYDEGWSLKVDGEEYDYFKILNGLIGVKLQPGEHKIEFKYKLPGLRTGHRDFYIFIGNINFSI